MHKVKSNISSVSANQAKKLVSSSNKCVFLFSRENQSHDESMRVKESLEECTKEKKHHLEEFLQAYRGLFQEPKKISPKRHVEHKILIFPKSPLLNIRLYR